MSALILPSNQVNDHQMSPVVDQLHLLLAALSDCTMGRVDGSRSGQWNQSVMRRAWDCAELLALETGANAVATACRGLLENAMQALWLDGRALHPYFEGSLRRDGNRIRQLVRKHGLSVPNLMRWENPVARELGHPGFALALPEGARLVQSNRASVAAVLGMSPAVSDLFALAGHSNLAAGWITTAPPPHAVGFTATPAYEALLAQSVGRSAVFALAVADDLAVRQLMDALTTTARGVHHLPECSDRLEVEGEAQSSPLGFDEAELLPQADLAIDGFEQFMVPVTRLYDLLLEAPSPYSSTEKVSNLTSVLPYLGVIGNFEVIAMSASGANAGTCGPLAARLALEEGARSRWRYSDPSDGELRRRYIAVADEETNRRQTLREALRRDGMGQDAETLLFDAIPDPSIDTPRTPVGLKAPKQPPPFQQMIQMGGAFAEVEWLDLAYVLLSQVVHGTPLGMQHLLDPRSPVSDSGLSLEMAVLMCDTGAIAAAEVLPGLSALFSMSGGTQPNKSWIDALRSQAANVHRSAQLLHFLD